MAVIPDFKATTINDFLIQNVAPGSTIFTDGLKTFTGLDEIFHHIPRTQPLRPSCTRERNPWCPSLIVPSGTSSSGSSVPTMGEPRPTAGLSGRVRLSAQSPKATHGGLPDAPRPRNHARINALRQHTQRQRPSETACPRLTTTYSASLKQPDKQESPNRCDQPPPTPDPD